MYMTPKLRTTEGNAVNASSELALEHDNPPSPDTFQHMMAITTNQ